MEDNSIAAVDSAANSVPNNAYAEMACEILEKARAGHITPAQSVKSMVCFITCAAPDVYDDDTGTLRASVERVNDLFLDGLISLKVAVAYVERMITGRPRDHAPCGADERLGS